MGIVVYTDEVIMDGLGFTMTVVLPLLMVACKLGIMFSAWGLVMAMTKGVNAATRYLNAKTFNEERK